MRNGIENKKVTTPQNGEAPLESHTMERGRTRKSPLHESGEALFEFYVNVLGFENGLATFVEGSFSCPAPLKTFDCFMAWKKRTKPTPDHENWLVVHGPFPQGSSGPVTPRTCPPDMLGAITSWLSYIGLNVVVIMTNSAHAEAFVLAQNDLAVIRNIVGAYDYSCIRQSSCPSPFVAYVYLSKYRSEEELPRDLANVARHNPSFPAHKYGKLTDPSPSPCIINSISGIPHSMHRHLDCEFFDPPMPPAPLPALPSPPAPSTLPAPTDLPAPAPQTGNPTQAEDPTSVSPVTHPPIVHPPIVHPPVVHPPVVHPPRRSSPVNPGPTPQASNSTEADDDQFTWDWAIPKREWVFRKSHLIEGLPHRQWHNKITILTIEPHWEKQAEDS
ncbi:hypothetical protein BS47DRAFT_1401304 [Hydnum rufescens UP504]|uniref:Uncharacterized protein n=1 Tax=Hydnum rufescens UP504 TaxID=1448309 RepID=A0A9P6DMW3_9AGAM|nr:hypothetical protein BS47DRAFT_1401304 [Hydnum rufescens UP504]